MGGAVLTPATLLLTKVKDLGFELDVHAERIRCRPAGSLPSDVRDEIAAHKAELIALLKTRQPTPQATDKTAKSAEPAPSGGSVSEGGVEPARVTTLDGSRPSLNCYACGGGRFWARRHGTMWVCVRCHPSDLRDDEVEWHVVPEVSARGAFRREPKGCVHCNGRGFVGNLSECWTVCPSCNSGWGDETGAGL